MRQKPLLLLLTAAVALLAANKYDQHQLGYQAEALVKICEEESVLPGVETASITTVGRDYVLFGAPFAKIEIFEQVRGQGKAFNIQGFEFHYRKIDGEWALQDSGRCAGGACAIRGREAFARLKGK